MLKKIKKGKINTKILALLLAIMLMFSNFTLLGSCIINGLVSYAVDAEVNNQDNKTNSENVVFEAYFINREGEKVYEVERDINCEDTKLYISLGVKNKGYLENAKIEFLDANFNLKNYENVVCSQEEDNNSENFGTVKTIVLNNNQINAGENIALKDDNGEEDGLTIRALTKLDSFNINSLKAISKIRLTGDYYEENSEEPIKIDTEKNVKVNWNSQSITEENSPIRLEQEFITNKILTVNEKNKRVVQLKVKSYLENNCYPIENTKMDIKLPKINNEYIEPEKITVVSYGTLATNGKDSLNFAKEQEEINTLGTWKYDQETQNITIDVKNTADENGNISWVKQSQDEFVVTYIYDENTVVNSLVSEVSSKLKLYTGTEIESEQNLLEITEITEIANPISMEISAPKELYKKNISMNKPTQYEEIWKIGISNSQVVDITELTSLDVFDIATNENYDIATSYKSTIINKNEFINLLGNDGAIEIYTYETKENPIKIGEIIINDSEDENIIFNYPGNTKNVFVLIKTNNALLDGGKLNIKHIKQIDPIQDKEKTTQIGAVDLSLTCISDNIETGVAFRIDLKETKIKAELGINLGRQDKTTLPVNQENEIDFTVTLHTEKEENKLYNNPIVKIDLPQEVTNMEILQADILNANGLSIKDKKIEGKSIIVELEGNQEEFEDYNYINTQLQLKAKIKTKELIPTLTRDVNLTVINNQNIEDVATDAKKITFEQTIKGLILANSVSGYNVAMPEIIAINEDKTGELQIQANTVPLTIKGTIVNNQQTTDSLEIVGNIVNESSNIEVVLLSPIEIEQGQVYYSEDGVNWGETLENAKQYKIVLEKGIEQEQVLEFSYKIQLPENLKANQSVELSYSIKEQDKKREIESAKIKLETGYVKVKVEESPIDVKFELMQNLNVLKMGREIGYLITITNKSNKDLNNIHIEYDALKELAYKEVGFNVGRELFEKQGNTYKSKQFNLKAKESTVIFIYADIVGYNQNGLINEILVKCEDNSQIIIAKDVKQIEEVANISMQITSNKQNVELKTDDTIEYSIVLKNNSLKDENIKLEVEVSEGLNIISTQINNGNITKESNLSKKQMFIDLEQGKIQEIKIIAKVNAVQENLEKDLNVFACAEAKIGEYLLAQTEKTNNIVKKLEKVITPEQSTGEQKTEQPVEPTVPEKSDKENQVGKPIENGQEQPNSKKNQISGKAWLDEDKDGLIDKNEKLLKGVLVRIKKINQDKKAEYVKDEKGEAIIAITDNNGQYEFENLLQGEYILEFEYNSKDYTVTPVSGKDSMAFISTTQEGTMVKTDTLKLNSNIENINIGLILNGVFDLELNKYVSKITVKNSSGTQVYNYNKTKLAKIEIKPKELKGSVVIIEYQIDVTNNGEVNANSILVADYAPTELKFSSELNTTWYQKSDGTLCCTELTDKELKPKETKSVKLVLTKTMTDTNTGIVNNTAEIAEVYNNSGLVDINSTPANKNQKENDFSNAEIIIGTATGSPIMYIAIVIISMLILGGGIYLINKKVIIKEFI